MTLPEFHGVVQNAMGWEGSKRHAATAAAGALDISWPRQLDDTSVYLSITPELLHEAWVCFDRYVNGGDHG